MLGLKRLCKNATDRATLFYLGVFAFILSWLLLMIGGGVLFPHSRSVSFSSADQEVSVLGTRIRYRVREGNNKDSGPVLILLHGFGGALDEWREVLTNLEPHKTIALDLVGFGGSDRPPIKYDLDTHRRYLIAFLKELNIHEAVLVGRSMGASIAAWTAARSKDEVVGLILIAPSGYPNSLSYPWPYSWLYRPGISNWLAGVVVRNSIFRWFFPNSLAGQAIGVTSSYDSNFASALRDIKQPTLLVWSPSDQTSLFKYHKDYGERIDNVELLELNESMGHSAHKKDPKMTASFISKFVKSMRAR